MDWDDVRFLPAEFLLSMSGVTGLMLAVGAATEGQPHAPAFGALSLLLLLAAGSLGPERRWSIGMASIAAWGAVPIWLASFLALDDPTDPSTGILCLGMTILAGWTSHFLRIELQPPEWLRIDQARAEPPIRGDGWIEELDDAPFPVRAGGRERVTFTAETRPRRTAY